MPLSDGIDDLCPAGGCLLLVTPAAMALCSVGAFASPYNYRSKYVLRQESERLGNENPLGHRRCKIANQVPPITGVGSG